MYPWYPSWFLRGMSCNPSLNYGEKVDLRSNGRCTVRACSGLVWLTQCWTIRNISFAWRYAVSNSKDRLCKSDTGGIPPSLICQITQCQLIGSYQCINAELWVLIYALNFFAITSFLISKSFTSAGMWLRGVSIAWSFAQHIWNWDNVKLEPSFLHVPPVHMMIKSLLIESAAFISRYSISSRILLKTLDQYSLPHHWAYYQ